MTTSRRKFIKISALGLCGAIASASALNLVGGNSYLNELVAQNIIKKLKNLRRIAKYVFGNVQLGLIQMTKEIFKKLLVMKLTHIVTDDYVQEEQVALECILMRID